MAGVYRRTIAAVFCTVILASAATQTFGAQVSTDQNRTGLRAFGFIARRVPLPADGDTTFVNLWTDPDLYVNGELIQPDDNTTSLSAIGVKYKDYTTIIVRPSGDSTGSLDITVNGNKLLTSVLTTLNLRYDGARLSLTFLKLTEPQPSESLTIVTPYMAFSINAVYANGLATLELQVEVRKFVHGLLDAQGLLGETLALSVTDTTTNHRSQESSSTNVIESLLENGAEGSVYGRRWLPNDEQEVVAQKTVQLFAAVTIAQTLLPVSIETENRKTPTEELWERFDTSSTLKSQASLRVGLSDVRVRVLSQKEFAESE